MKILGWILKRKLLLLGFLAVMITANAQNTSYISNHKSLTEELSAEYGIPYSVILAVAIVESSSGVGKAAKKLNNHFGIVGSNHLPKKGYRSRYKQYDTDADSFLDFCRVISHKNFYADLKNNNDPKQWVKAISQSGYSGKPQIWEKRILNTISTNRL